MAQYLDGQGLTTLVGKIKGVTGTPDNEKTLQDEIDALESGKVDKSELASATVSKATTADSATKATQDADGNIISTTYLKSSSTLDATKLSGTIPSSCYTDTDTTYSAGTGLSLTGTTFSNAGVTSFNGSTGAVTATIPVITSGTTDLEAGTSSLASGTIYLVYE